MDDIISRQAAIDVIDEIETEVANGLGFQYEKWRKHFSEMPSVQPLPETDLLELEHRFGSGVRYVVEDMLSGEERRWKNGELR